jgi:hypothetical protein
MDSIGSNCALLLSLHTFWQHDGVKVRGGAFTCKDLVVNTLQKCEGVKALSIFLYGKLFTAYLSCWEQSSHYNHAESEELTEIEGEGL